VPAHRGLIVLSHSDERPDSYLESSFFKAMASKLSWQMCWKATSRRLDSLTYQKSSTIGSEPPIKCAFAYLDRLTAKVVAEMMCFARSVACVLAVRWTRTLRLLVSH
jgi:hypothetical protein